MQFGKYLGNIIDGNYRRNKNCSKKSTTKKKKLFNKNYLNKFLFY